MARAFKHPYADFLGEVQKPTRYIGGEYQEVRKDPATVRARVCLAFPDTYEIGMSHLGTKILYSGLNKTPGIACERSRPGWTWRPSCASAACPCSRSRPRRPCRTSTSSASRCSTS